MSADAVESSKDLIAILPDTETATATRFGFSQLSEILVNVIMNEKNMTPMTIGIHGPWGTGKTSLMKTIEQKLLNRSNLPGERNKVKTVWFNAWRYAAEESILTALLNEVIRKDVKEAGQKNSKVVAILNSFTTRAGWLAYIVTSAVTSAVLQVGGPPQITP